MKKKLNTIRTTKLEAALARTATRRDFKDWDRCGGHSEASGSGGEARGTREKKKFLGPFERVSESVRERPV